MLILQMNISSLWRIIDFHLQFTIMQFIIHNSQVIQQSGVLFGTKFYGFDDYFTIQSLKTLTVNHAMSTITLWVTTSLLKSEWY